MTKKANLTSLKIRKHATRAAIIGAPEQGGRIPVVFSSETPVPTLDVAGNLYLEVLDHNIENIDLSGLRDGNRLSFLESHMKKPMRVLGSITDITFPQDVEPKVGRGFMEFSGSEQGRAAEIDFTERHREFVSVGLQKIMPPISITRDAATGLRILRLKWRPNEISGVHRPGDPSTAAYRSAAETNKDDIIEIPINSEREEKMKLTPEQQEVKLKEIETREAALKISETTVREAEEKLNIQVGDNKAAIELARRDGLDNIALFAVRDLKVDALKVQTEAQRMKTEGIGAEELRKWAMAQFAERQALSAEDNNLGMSKGDQLKFDIAKAVRAMHTGDFNDSNKSVGLELEASRAADQLQPAMSNVSYDSTSDIGFTLPRDIIFSEARREALTKTDIGFILAKLESERAMSVDQAAKGGAWTAEGISASRFIDFLHSALILTQINATHIPGLTTDLTFPELLGIQTAYMRGEQEDATLSDLTTGTRKLSPRLASAGTSLTWLLQTQASGMGVDRIIEMEMARAMAILKNQQVIYGTGANSQVLGLANLSGINLIAGGTNGLAPTQDNYIRMRTAVAEANALDLPGQPSIFLLNSTTIGKNKRTVVESGQTDRVQDVYGRDKGLIGEPVVESNLLRSNLTKGSGTALSEAFYLNAQEIYVGQWGTPRVIVDRATGAAADKTTTYIHEYWDMLVAHHVAVSRMNDIITT